MTQLQLKLQLFREHAVRFYTEAKEALLEEWIGLCLQKRGYATYLQNLFIMKLTVVSIFEPFGN